MPRRPPSPCRHPTCPHPRPCPTHDHDPEAERQRNTRRANARRVYKSARWRRLRGAKLQRDPWCEEPGCRAEAIDVDHVDALEDGGEAYDWANLQSLCKRHHGEKTAAEVAARRRGRGVEIAADRPLGTVRGTFRPPPEVGPGSSPEGPGPGYPPRP